MSIQRKDFPLDRIHTPPANMIDSPIIHFLADVASRASLHDTKGYGSGVWKFHIFCDIFSISEADHLPALFELLHSFAIWAISDPSLLIVDTTPLETTQFKPISIITVQKYLAAVRAWHIAQGWLAPLSDDHHNCINWKTSRVLARNQFAPLSQYPCSDPSRWH